MQLFVLVLFVLVGLLSVVVQTQAKVYFQDNFDGPEKKWVTSTATKGDTAYTGTFKVEKVDNKTETLDDNNALVTTEANQHYCESALLDEVFEFRDAPLIVQFSVRFQEQMACGGSYMKLLAADKDLQLTSVKDDTLYSILFGPDKCGGDAHLRFIFQFKNPQTGSYREVHANKIEGIQKALYSDKKSHLVTLVMNPDNMFTVSVDGKEMMAGKLGSEEAFSQKKLIPPKTIDDPADKKPEDWVDEKMMDDPEDMKPDDWVDDAHILDPSATKPVDWDEDMDGEWEAPTIANPLYKGQFIPKKIENPAYKGVWKPKQLENPEYFTETDPFSKLLPIKAVSFELWTTTAKTAYDDIIITDSMEEAEAATNKWQQRRTQQDLDENSGFFAMFGQVIDATNERPWLWAVYALVLFIPIYLLFFAGGEEELEEKAAAPKAKAQSSVDGNGKSNNADNEGDDKDDDNEGDDGDDDNDDDDDDDDEDEADDETENDN